MKRVYNLVENMETLEGYYYPSEGGEQCSMFMIIEGNEDGTLDDEYSIDCFDMSTDKTYPLILKRNNETIYETQFKNFHLIFELDTRLNGSYNGVLNGPKEPLWHILPTEETNELLEIICKEHNVILIGYCEFLEESSSNDLSKEPEISTK
jgi:hypothetical protein